MQSFIMKHKDEDVRRQSRSGGMFTALSDVILERGGTVYGCALDEQFDAVFIRAVDRAGRNRMRGSKYIQGRIGDSFRLAGKDLCQARPVLFSGTPCQVAGLRAYLRVKHIPAEHLFAVDIVCHGIPSRALWEDHVADTLRKNPGKLEKVNFRNKEKYGWQAHLDTLTIDGTEYDSAVFTRLFYGHDILRPSCYICRYKNLDRTGDLTLADAWGVTTADPDFNDDRGVSLVLVNTDKGRTLFDAAAKSCLCRPVNMQEYMQPPLQAPFVKPAERDRFWMEYKSRGYKFVVKKYATDSFLKRIRHAVGRRFHRVCRRK